mgnify:CR=1 FL=1
MCTASGLEREEDELETIFNDLDLDGDGRISKKDFLTGFEGVLACPSFVTSTPSRKRVHGQSMLELRCESMDEASFRKECMSPRKKGRCWNKFMTDMGLDFYLLAEDRWVIQIPGYIKTRNVVILMITSFIM